MAPRYKQIEASLILVDRDGRQRRELTNIEELADSIRRLGVINPITIKMDYTLIAGERRLMACRSIDENFKVPCRFYEELDNTQLQLVELEENVKREELDWKDKALSIKRIHELYSSVNPEWTIVKTADAIGIVPNWVSTNCTVAERLIAGDKKVHFAESISAAKNIINRETERAIDNELNDLLEVERESEDSGEHISIATLSGPIYDGKPAPLGEIKIAPEAAGIINSNFLEWLETYQGRRFNLIHCDFPYGINHGESDQGGTAGGQYTGYEDSPDTYWRLCSALCHSIDKLMTPSGHLMFWFTMKYYRETVEFFEKYSDLQLVMEHPLIWYKSDGRGIVSDVNRRPRNVYETALLFSRGDRKILSPVDNCYACPTAKSRALHVSEKPEPMLRHFFRMFIDGYSEVLDPTCGAGSALRAADSLGAKRVLGLELNKEFAEEANAQLRRSRTLDRLSAAVTKEGD